KADGTTLYSGSATADVTAGGTTQVAILAQEVNATPGPQTHAPVIDSLTSSAVLVTPGSTVSVAVAAHDPDNNALTYFWQDTCGGSFAAAASAMTTWMAPAVAPANPCQLSVTVSDATNQTSVTAYIVIQVRNANSGNAQVDATFNTFPVVTVVKVAEYIVQEGQ